MGYREPRLETWVRQRGKALYTEDGQLGYDLEDLTAYFAFWKMIQDEGLTPPADLQSQDSDGKMETTMLVTGKSVFGFIHSNQLVAQPEAGARGDQHHDDPEPEGREAGPVPEALDAALDRRDLGDKEAAAELMNFFITDLDANAILQIERGVSGDPAVREAILPGLSETEKKIIDYLDIVATAVGPLPPPPPKNAGELDRALRPAWDSISFEKVAVEDGAKQYYDNAVAILARA